MTLDESSVVHHQYSLPPADKGRDAWLFLVAAFIMEALVWGMLLVQFTSSRYGLTGYTGFLYSFGVFQDYYQSHLPFARSSNTATIGTCAMVSCNLQQV